MIRGLYTAASGLRAQLTRQKILTNNLANALTPGYRQDRPVVESFPHLAVAQYPSAGSTADLAQRTLGELGRGLLLDENTLDLSEGSRFETGQDLDLAIAGDGYFVVQTANGNAYTRDGRFQVDAEGRLVTLEGWSVLGENGPITLGADPPAILEDGSVVIQGAPLDRLQIVTFPAGTDLRKQAGNLLVAEGGAAPIAAVGRVQQGMLEGANVAIEDNQIQLMATLRAYQFTRDALRANDETLGRAVNEIGRLA